MPGNSAVHSYVVGKPYVPGRTSWPETGEYNYRSGRHELRLFWSSPADAEIKAVRSGRIETRFLVHGPVIFFLYRIDGACGWSDAPFSVHLLPEAERTRPDEGSTAGLFEHLLVFLVDAATGILKAIRTTSIESDAAAFLRAALLSQHDLTWDEGEYDRSVKSAYSLYSDSDSMAKEAGRRMSSLPQDTQMAERNLALLPGWREDLPRPKRYLLRVKELFPDAWRFLDGMVAEKGKSLPAWPDYVYLPVAASYAVVSGGSDSALDLGEAGLIGGLAALAAWRPSQGIYRFDPDLFAALVETPLEGDIPHQVLHKMPEWCVYVETPGLSVAQGALRGFFAHLEADTHTGEEELRLAFDTDTGLHPFPLHLGAWGLEKAVQGTFDYADAQARKRGFALPSAGFRPAAEIAGMVQPILSLLLYLCSVNADIGRDERRPVRPELVKTKKGLRVFPPGTPAVWDVGVRIGAALRAYRGDEGRVEGRSGRSHAPPRPHIRRAHWHTYWTGPRKAGTKGETGDQTPVLKWLPPIPVGVQAEDLPATIRSVKF